MNLPVFRRVPLLSEIVEEEVATGLVSVRVGIHAVERVGRANHVVVEVEPDLVLLLLRQLRDIVDGSDEAALLGTPPCQTDLVLDALVFLDGLGEREESSGAAAIIVDTCKGLVTNSRQREAVSRTWTLLHRVKVSAEHDHVVRVALLGLRNDIPALALLGNGIDDEIHLDSLASIDEPLPLRSFLQRDNSHRGEGAVVLGAESGRGDGRTGNVVDQHDTQGALLLGDPELVGDGADAPLDESNLAINIHALPLVFDAARPVHVVDREGYKGSSDTVGERCGVVVLQRNDLDVLAIRAGKGDGVGSGEEVSERLDVGVEILAVATLHAVEDIV
jgi:hypothetical protein